MEQPLGYVAQGESSKVCLSQRAIYRLKQSPCTWFAKFSSLLTTFGFTSCVIDPIMLNKTTKGSLVILVVYIDDIILTRSMILVFILPRILYNNTLVSETGES